MADSGRDSQPEWRRPGIGSGSPAQKQRPTSKFFEQYQPPQVAASPFLYPSASERTVDTTSCESYKDFKTTLDSMRECFEVLNPIKGAVCGPGGPLQSETGKSLDLNPFAMEFIRGGIVRAVALFEGYVKELMQDAFTAAFLERVDNPQILKGVWPNCQTAIQNALLKPKQPLEVVACNALVTENGWRKLIEAHLENCLKKLKSPLFGIPKGSEQEAQEDEGIDATFRSLFLPKEKKFSISSKMIDRNITVKFRTGPNSEDVEDIVFQNVYELWNVTRLYYGIRCVFAHGDPAPTLKRSLGEFPEDPETLLGGQSPHASKHLCDLYYRVRNYKSDATVSYLTWINMNRFLRTTAKHLQHAVASYVCDTYEYPDNEGGTSRMKLWGHPKSPPDGDAGEQN